MIWASSSAREIELSAGSVDTSVGAIDASAREVEVSVGAIDASAGAADALAGEVEALVAGVPLSMYGSVETGWISSIVGKLC